MSWQPHTMGSAELQPGPACGLHRGRSYLGGGRLAPSTHRCPVLGRWSLACGSLQGRGVGLREPWHSWGGWEGRPQEGQPPVPTTQACLHTAPVHLAPCIPSPQRLPCAGDRHALPQVVQPEEGQGLGWPRGLGVTWGGPAGPGAVSGKAVWRSDWRRRGALGVFQSLGAQLEGWRSPGTSGSASGDSRRGW